MSRLVAATVLLGLTQLLGACSSGPGGDTTCSAFAALSTDDQEKAAQNLLKDKGLDPLQSGVARLDIDSYCQIYDGPAGAHQDDPISDTPAIHG